MAKKRRKKHGLDTRSCLLIAGVFFILFGLLAIFRVGFLGMVMANIFRLLVGNSYLLLASLIVLYGGYLVLFQKEPTFEQRHLLYGGLFLYIGILLWMTTYFSQDFNDESRRHMIHILWQATTDDIRMNMITQNLAGGMIGAFLYEGVHFLVAQVGTYIVSVLCIIGGIIQLFHLNLSMIADFCYQAGRSLITYGEHLQNRKADWQEERRKLQEEKRKQKNQKDLEKEEQETWEEEPEVEWDPIEEDTEEFWDDEDSFPELEDDLLLDEPKPVTKESASKNDNIIEETEPMTFSAQNDADYQLPSVELLNHVAPADQSGERKIVDKKKKILMKTFESFGVDARVESVHLGPSITKFEVRLAVGVKVSKIVNLADDLALALAAKDVRIEAPIPGKSLIGIEVPNQTIRMVTVREIIEERGIQRDKLLNVPLGRDISGDVISCNLAEMPHLLIAGSTGSGKSVCINDIIISLLMQAKPNEVKLLMIDPKMVELSVYNGIPHLLTPVVTDPRKASQALHKAVEEMERRYDLFAKEGVRNMKGYNQRHPEEPLPYMVIIVDELADLMMVASKEVEDSIIRLAQKARAAGIHMILATQRPSVDVITGLIKANVPSRIAFAVSSGTDSRTILDSNGAEKLLGKGDMLYCPIGQNKPTRVQGAFISDEEVETVIDFITEQQGPQYIEAMTPTEEPQMNEENSVHPRFDEAVEIIREEQKASVSLIQRRLHIGYNAAANIIEEMENRGFVGPSQGSKPREVYLPKEKEEEI